MCPPSDPRRQLGDHGEDLAAAALKQQGYKILERNYVTPLGEIDLIARQGKVVVVVEVKTRRGSSFGAPQEAVNSGQARPVAAAGGLLPQGQTPHRVPGALRRGGRHPGGDVPQVEIIPTLLKAGRKGFRVSVDQHG